MTETTIPYLKITGNPHEIGYKVGKTFKTNITHFLDEFAEFKKHKLAYPNKERLIKKMLMISKRLCPNIIDEIEGISDGSGVGFDDLFIHNCMHMPHWEDSSHNYGENCSTSVFRHNNTIHIAHNEDAHPLLEKYAYFVFITPQGPKSIPFFSHCYPGIVPGMSYGFNLTGITQTCNSLPDPIKSTGLPRMFVGRTIYENAYSIDEAIKIINKLTPRSGGASYTLGSASEQNIVNVETTGTDQATIKIHDHFFRANHYISGKFRKYPAASKHTIVRQNRGDSLLPKNQDPTALLDIMRDESIFLTMEGTNNDCQTNSTLIFKITEDNIVLKKYNDRESQEYSAIQLKHFL